MDLLNLSVLGIQAESYAAQIIPVILGIIVTLVQCFFGYKLFRYIMGFWGFALFGYAGYIAAHGFGNQTATISVCVILGAIGAFIAYKYYKAGVFLQGLIAGYLIGIIISLFAEWPPTASVAFSFVLGILLGVLTMQLLKPLIVLTSAISGGMASGAAIAGLLNLSPGVNTFLGVVLTILGVGYQFYVIGKDKRDDGGKDDKKKDRTKKRDKKKGSKDEADETEPGKSELGKTEDEKTEIGVTVPPENTPENSADEVAAPIPETLETATVASSDIAETDEADVSVPEKISDYIEEITVGAEKAADTTEA